MSSFLPVHGFVLAGGQSTRMGQDKALLPFLGRPMVEIAVEKLRSFCAAVSIVGNREDLQRFAPVIREARIECGPAAGIEAGLLNSQQVWALFIPVDVPLVPAEMLRRWAETTLHGLNADEYGQKRDYYSTSLRTMGCKQPAFLMARTSQVSYYTQELERGCRRLGTIQEAMWRDYNKGNVFLDAASFAPSEQPTDAEMEFWFSNVNTKNELETAEMWAEAWRGRRADPSE